MLKILKRFFPPSFSFHSSTRTFSTEKRMKIIGLKDGKFGGIEQLEFQERPIPTPRKDELLVKVKAAALNRADILQRQGKYPPPSGDSEIIGLEIAGVVEREGNQSGIKKGSRVFGIVGGGGYAQYCTIPTSLAMAIPDNFSFEEAVAIPEVFLTSFQTLYWLGEIKQKSSSPINVLIHAGASGVGTACIQLCKLFPNVKVIVTVGNEEKQKFCTSLGADLAINYKMDNFATKVLDFTNKKGADILVDFIGAPYWNDNLKCMNTDSIMVSLAMMGGIKVENSNLYPILAKRIHVKGSTLRSRSLEYRTQLTKDFVETILPHFRSGKLKPVISKIFDWKDIQKAHEMMESNQNSGKIILNNIN